MPTEEPVLLSSLHFQQGEKDMADAWLPRHREINSKEMLPHSEVPWAGVIVYILTGWAEYPTTNLAVMVESPSMGPVLMILTQPIYWPAVVLNKKWRHDGSLLYFHGVACLEFPAKMIFYFYCSPWDGKRKCCAHAAIPMLKGQEFWQEEEEETMFTEKNSTPAVSFCKSGMGKRQ